MNIHWPIWFPRPDSSSYLAVRNRLLATHRRKNDRGGYIYIFSFRVLRLYANRRYLYWGVNNCWLIDLAEKHSRTPSTQESNFYTSDQRFEIQFFLNLRSGSARRVLCLRFIHARHEIIVIQEYSQAHMHASIEEIIGELSHALIIIYLAKTKRQTVIDISHSRRCLLSGFIVVWWQLSLLFSDLIWWLVLCLSSIVCFSAYNVVWWPPPTQHTAESNSKLLLLSRLGGKIDSDRCWRCRLSFGFTWTISVA